LEWLDDSSVRYIPAGAPGKDGLSVTFGEGARAANGLALPAPVQARFQAPGELLPAERLPAPGTEEVDPSSAVVVTFNHPVTPLGSETDEPPAFTISPEAPGRGVWLNTSTYIFYPEPALLGGTRYTVSLAPSLTAADGALPPAGAETEWSFTTAAPVLLSVEPTTERPVPLDSAFTLRFNQPMNRASVETEFSLTRSGGDPVQGVFTWEASSRAVTFQPSALLERGAAYNLVLLGAAVGQGGSPLGQNFAAVIATVPQFAVTETRPAAGESLSTYSGYATVQLGFSAPVAPGQNLQSLITIEPALPELTISRDPSGYYLYLSGYFPPSASYTLTAAADLQDRWGAALGMPFSFTFSTEPAAPNLVFPGRMLNGSVLFVPQNETSLPAYATNLTQMNLKRGALSLSDFIRASQSAAPLEGWSSQVQSEWNVSLNLTQNINQQVDVPLSVDRAPLPSGLYFLRADTVPAIDERFDSAPALLVVSPIQMVVKTSVRQLFVWAVRLENQSPVGGAEVVFYDSDAQRIAACSTDPDGRCQVERPVDKDLFEPVFAVIGQPGQPDFSLAASHWISGIAPWDFGVPLIFKDHNPKIYLYTDRPIYQPGQRVHFRAVLREQDNGRYPAPIAQAVTAEIISPYDALTGQSTVLAALPLALDEFGAAEGVFALPEDAPTGAYMLRLRELEAGEIPFTVAEYRKPEIDLQVQMAQADQLTGDDVTMRGTARYFYGAPAGNVSLRWTIYRRPAWLSLPDGLQVGPQDWAWTRPWDSFVFAGESYVTDGQAVTAPDGTFSVTVPGAVLRERLGDAANDTMILAVEVTVEDESGLPVSARADARSHPASYLIGARAESWSGQAGQEMTYTVRTMDWSAVPLASQALQARFLKVAWRDHAGDTLLPPRVEPVFREVGSTDFTTSERGEARLAFTPDEPGTYVLEVTGAEETGTVPLTQVLSWVGGPGAAPWPNLPNQRLVLRADSNSASGPGGAQPAAYAPGDTARIFLPNPFPDGALALVTVERARVMESFITLVQGGSHTLELPITNEHAPNIFVSVTLLGRTGGRPDFRMGYIELRVDASALLLQVDIQPSPAQPQPGGDLTLNVRVRDAQGSPVQGRFSLALIDKAVLALIDPNTSPIDDAFYGPQPLGVQSSLSLAAYAGRALYNPPGRGGGGGAVDPAGGIRSRFEDTAYWNGALETDVTGVAQVTIPLPDNLTTWRADVRGLTQDGRVGQAQLDLTVGKPLLLAPITPRFVVVGDYLEMAAVVHNNTSKTLQVGARLESAGFALDDPNLAVQPVEIAAGERQRISWWGRVLDVPALDLAFSVESDARSSDPPLQDAARPAGGPLPVLRYVSPQTFGTAGMLPEAGQQTELVSLPRSFSPVGGALEVDLAPSLAATVLDGLKALESFPYDFTEPVISRLLPNQITHEVLVEFQMQDATLRASLAEAIASDSSRITRLQNADGGWGWSSGAPSDPYLSAYALLALSRVAKSGAFVSADVLQRAQDYLAGQLIVPSTQMESWQVDRAAFQSYALAQSGRSGVALDGLYTYRAALSPWGASFLALALEAQTPGDQRARTLVSDLASSASRSATGAHWQDTGDRTRNWTTTATTTAAVVYAMATIDPASTVLVDGVRYLVLNRRVSGAWASTYESAWALAAMAAAMRGTGDLQASYTFSAAVNGTPLASSLISTPAQAANPVRSSLPVQNLRPDLPNALVIARGEGEGRLYYRAYLRVDRPVEQAPPVQRGMSIARQYVLAGQDCARRACPPLEVIDLGNPQPVQVRLTLTVPEDMYYVVVEDTLPAGAEVLNPGLRTSQQFTVPIPLPEGAPPETEDVDRPMYNPTDPFGVGWGWWRFTSPQIHGDRVRWVAESLPAGTYTLTYRITPYLAGDFRVLPARAWQFYFPEVEGASAGEVLPMR
jgi:uncharacterized protein YfaS (alpha-2-macroglobulin family)